MKIAIPIQQGQLSEHFGHSEKFAVLQVDKDNKRIIERNDMTPPPHEPGVLPRWLHELKVDVVIAGGLGMRARQIFDAVGIQVVTGAPVASPEDLVRDYLSGALVSRDVSCNHGGCGDHHH